MLSFMEKKFKTLSPITLPVYWLLGSNLLLLPHPKALICGFKQNVIAAVFPLARHSTSPMSFLIKGTFCALFVLISLLLLKLVLTGHWKAHLELFFRDILQRICCDSLFIKSKIGVSVSKLVWLEVMYW